MMNTRILFAAALSALAATAAAADPPVATTAAAAGTVTGSAQFRGQRLALSHGIAWWDAADNEVRLALFDHPPPAGMLADLRAGSWGEGGPSVTVRLRFDRAAPPSLASVTYCFLDASFPKGGPMGTNTDAKGCGLTGLAGTLSPGGVVRATLKAQAGGPGDQPYTWDLMLDLPIAYEAR